MTTFSPEPSAFAALLDAQPEPVRRAFHDCLALLMVEDGKAQLVETQPGEAGPVLTFETVAGDRFGLARLAMSEEVEERVLKVIREVLGEVDL